MVSGASAKSIAARTSPREPTWICSGHSGGDELDYVRVDCRHEAHGDSGRLKPRGLECCSRGMVRDMRSPARPSARIGGLAGSLLAAYAFAVAMAGTTLPTPLYPLYREEFSFSQFLV